MDKKLQERIEKLIKQLGSDMRDTAISEVTRIGEPAVPHLVGAFKSQNAPVRLKIIEILDNIGNPSTVNLLIEASKDPDYSVRKKAVTLLAKFKSEKVERVLVEASQKLIKQLYSGNWEFAYYELIAIGSHAVPALVNLLSDKNRNIRQKAVLALGHIGDEQAIGPLIKTLGDIASMVRLKAAWGLVQIGESAIPVLIKALKNEDLLVRNGVAKVLGGIGEHALEEVNQAYLEGKVSYEDFHLFCEVLEEKLKGEKFDKGTVAPPKKKPTDLKDDKKLKRTLSQGLLRKGKRGRLTRGVAVG